MHLNTFCGRAGGMAQDGVPKKIPIFSNPNVDRYAMIS